MGSLFKIVRKHINEFLTNRSCRNRFHCRRSLIAQNQKTLSLKHLEEVLDLYRSSQLFRASLDPFEPTYEISGKVFWTGASDDILLLKNNVFYTEHLCSGVPPVQIELLHWIANTQAIALLDNEEFPNDPYEGLEEDALPPQEALNEVLDQLKLLKLRTDQEKYVLGVLNDAYSIVKMPSFQDTNFNDLLRILIRMPKRDARARFGHDLKLANVINENDLALFADAAAIDSIEKSCASLKRKLTGDNLLC
jgi:hypothetical protein